MLPLLMYHEISMPPSPFQDRAAKWVRATRRAVCLLRCEVLLFLTCDWFTNPIDFKGNLEHLCGVISQLFAIENCWNAHKYFLTWILQTIDANFYARIRRIREGNVFTCVCLSIGVGTTLAKWPGYLLDRTRRFGVPQTKPRGTPTNRTRD